MKTIEKEEKIMKIKEKFIKCKEWVKEHKKEVLTIGISTVVVGIGAAILGKSKKETKIEELSEPETDFGRNCTMKFVVDETQEVLGEIPCTELYAKENLEDYEEFKK